jgi:hypothetical protein
MTEVLGQRVAAMTAPQPNPAVSYQVSGPVMIPDSPGVAGLRAVVQDHNVGVDPLTGRPSGQCFWPAESLNSSSGLLTSSSRLLTLLRRCEGKLSLEGSSGRYEGNRMRAHHATAFHHQVTAVFRSRDGEGFDSAD